MAYPGLTIIFASFLIFLGQFGYSNGQCADDGCSATDLGSFEYLQRDPEPDAQGCYSNNAQVTLTCASPAAPEGTTTNTCNGGRWAQGPITCNVQCTPLDVDNLIQSPDEAMYDVGDKVTFSCEEGYILTSNSPRFAHCIDTGTLNSTQEPECVVSCSPPLALENLILTPNKTTYVVGEEVNFSCNEGYKLTSDSPRSAQCKDTGKLINPTQELKCIAFNCSAPNTTTEHLNWTDKGKKQTYNGNGTITYSCPEGFKVNGNKTNTCIDQDEWENKDPTCSSGNVVQVFSYFLLMTTFYSVFSFYM